MGLTLPRLAYKAYRRPALVELFPLTIRMYSSFCVYIYIELTHNLSDPYLFSSAGEAFGCGAMVKFVSLPGPPPRLASHAAAQLGSRARGEPPFTGYCHEQALVCLSNREIVDASRGRTLHYKMANNHLKVLCSY